MIYMIYLCLKIDNKAIHIFNKNIMRVFCSKAQTKDNLNPEDQYQIVRQLAKTIGLSTTSRNTQPASPYISNKNSKKSKTRRLNHCDLRQYERQQTSRQVRSRNKSMNEFYKQISKKSQSYRKNAVKDIMMQHQKPQNNPAIVLNNKKIICRKDLQRSRLIDFNSKILEKRAEEKQVRSKILIDLSQKLMEQQSFVLASTKISSKDKVKSRGNWVKNIFDLKATSTTKTQISRLVGSLDLSKFNLTQKKEGLYLQSNTYERNVQTSQSNRNRRNLKLRCQNNRFQIDVSKTENLSCILHQIQGQRQQKA